MRYHRPFFLALFISLFPSRLFAWGYVGHQLVAELAMSMLSDATRMKIERVLNGMSAGEAESWLDEVRSSTAYWHIAPWHFVNINQGEIYKPAPKADISSQHLIRPILNCSIRRN